MFLVCFSFYASLVATVPTSYVCQNMNGPAVHIAVNACTSEKDPLTTCEARQPGALKWFITRRYVGGAK